MICKKWITAILCLLLVSCNNDDKTSEFIEAEVESGAFIRTVAFNNSDLVLDDPASTFSVLLEVQDEQEGQLVQNIEVYASFADQNNDNGNQGTSEVLVKIIEPDTFTIGPDNLPQTSLELSYAELVAATNVQADLILCQDQFLLRLVLNLNDGRTFSTNNGSSSVVIAFDTLFSSPFCYTLNIVPSIAPDLFVGEYQYESIIDGPIGPTFGLPNTVNIRVGESPNTRVFEANYIVSRLNEPPRTFRFVVGCDEILFRKNQLSSFFSWCRSGSPEGGFSFGGPPILFGPDSSNAAVNTEDDSTFELHFVEGFLGWDGDCNFGETSVKLLFTKQ